ncbi:MAG: hypothetical protein IKH13_04840, partial [Clostridia bacterium]|nr:hypothetical protein [Clostridia bacterium]
AHALPESDVKEEKMWRKQEIKNAKMLESSKRLALQCYPDGVITYNPEKADRAYNMPDDTKEKAKARRQAMKEASMEQNVYSSYAAPYLTAQRTLELYEGYNNLDELIADYDKTVSERRARHDAEREEQERLAAERRLDKERYEAEKKMKKRK